MTNPTSLALITARGGSKRIPRKNIRPFAGQPIIAYPIQAALSADVFTEVCVSTDDEEIARIAREYGAGVPFFRSAETSGDYATTDQVIAEVLTQYEEQLGRHFDRFCCIYPTAPMLEASQLAEAMALLDQHESVMSVVPFSYPPQRSFVLRADHLIRLHPEYTSTRSQDLETQYHDAGQFYACRTDAFFRGETTDVEDLYPFILSERAVQDIDTEEDWRIAEDKFRLLHPHGINARRGANP